MKDAYFRSDSTIARQCLSLLQSGSHGHVVKVAGFRGIVVGTSVAIALDVDAIDARQKADEKMRLDLNNVSEDFVKELARSAAEDDRGATGDHRAYARKLVTSNFWASCKMENVFVDEYAAAMAAA